MVNEEIGEIIFQDISSEELVDQEVRELSDGIIDMINTFKRSLK